MDRVIRYRPRWRQLPWWNLLFFIQPTINVLSGRLSGWWLLPLVVVYVGSLVLHRHFGVELRPDALVAYGLRTRVIPWRQIQWIGPSRLFTEDAVGVAYGGEVLRLRAPRHWLLTPDPDFRAKAGMIHGYWGRHRGSEWRPPPATWPWPT
ncbi:MAG TPA: hypothetical protein VNA20_00655 [Frankiaceae bacterium]|nr:hypothetical protein [Frankiaceae bacterium]